MSVEVLHTALGERRGLLEGLERLRLLLAAVLEGQASELPEPEADSALGLIGRRFGLSVFEQYLLLLCAGVELDGSLAALCAEAQGDGGAPRPTFSLALAALPGAHWDALSPARPLRRWRLIEVEPGAALTTSPLRIGEPVLHALAGASTLDERLIRLALPVAEEPLAPSHAHAAAEIAALWGRDRTGRRPLVQLHGVGCRQGPAIAAAACASLGLRLHAMRASLLPAAPAELELLATLWERDALLLGSALLVEIDDLLDDQHTAVARRFAETVGGLTFLAARERLTLHRPQAAFEIGRPLAHEQRALWRAALGPLGATLGDHVDTIAAQFTLDAPAIAEAGEEVRRQLPGDVEAAAVERAVWRQCRVQSRSRLEDLAQRIEPAAAWGDLVLPEQQLATLHDLAAHVRQRATVYERWGFGEPNGRGLGISALFAGPSGTGKTTAAEVLAGVLELDLYRIDLSGVVSKYIGETERNLRRIFDAAEESGALLLFDEADALFGKRSEVKDSHDRYANIEVGYLLQRMESYRGLVALTTNLKHAIDHAFLRRLRFVVQFPFPDANQRAALWRRMIPRAVPAEGLCFERLAQLNVAGGSIRTIALNAAFIAADAAEPLRMGHILRAARAEYAKLEKPLTETEIAGWQRPPEAPSTADERTDR